MSFIYFNTELAIKAHDLIIEKSGGSEGTLHSNLIESCLEHLKNDDYYPNFEDKLTHLVFSLVKNHMFVDGNKRSAIYLSAFFLEINGFGYIVEEYIFRLENIVVYVADNKIDIDLLKDLLYSIVFELDYSEALKLRLTRALSN